MDSNDELKETDIKNPMCHYFHDIMRVRDFVFDNTFLDETSYENSYENILIYDIWFKTFMGAKP